MVTSPDVFFSTILISDSLSCFTISSSEITFLSASVSSWQEARRLFNSYSQKFMHITPSLNHWQIWVHTSSSFWWSTSIWEIFSFICCLNKLISSWASCNCCSYEEILSASDCTRCSCCSRSLHSADSWLAWVWWWAAQEATMASCRCNNSHVWICMYTCLHTHTQHTHTHTHGMFTFSWSSCCLRSFKLL